MDDNAMEDQMPSPIKPNRRTIIAALPAALAASLALLPVGLAAADVPVTPFVDCVRANPDAGTYTAFFGYNNTGPVPFRFDAGTADNYAFPGSMNFEQPTFFSPGNYPRVGSVTFDGVFIGTVTWTLNGISVGASANSPRCTSGITSPASDLAGPSATLNGVVTPEGEDVTYSFEYGTSASALSNSTTTQDAGSGTLPQLVQTTLSNLTPSTKYFFRLVTTSAIAGTTDNAVQSFTTPAPSTSAPLGVGTTSLPHATYGTRYSQPLAGSGGTTPYAWSVTAGSLPAGLSLDVNTGTISGTPSVVATSQFTVTATDASTPTHNTANQPLSITVEQAATSIHVVASENPAATGRPVTYTAVVSGTPAAPDTPTGGVTFTDNGGPANCGGGTQTLTQTGIATCTVFYRQPGAHAIAARYGGDARYAGSTSAVLAETAKRRRR